MTELNPPTTASLRLDTSTWDQLQTCDKTPKSCISKSPLVSPKLTKALNSMNWMVVEERLENCEKIDMSSIEQIKESMEYMNFKDDAQATSFSKQIRRGEKEYNHILKHCKVTEADINLLHSLFMLKQKRGLLSYSSFWQLFRFFHGLEDNLISDVIVVQPEATSPCFILNSNSMTPNVNASEIPKLKFHSLEQTSISSTESKAVNEFVPLSSIAPPSNHLNSESRRNSAVPPDISLGSRRNSECSRRGSIPKNIYFSFTNSNTISGINLKVIMNSDNDFGKRVMILTDLKKIGEICFLHFALFITVCAGCSALPLSAMIFELLDLNKTRFLEKNPILDFFASLESYNLNCHLLLVKEIEMFFEKFGCDSVSVVDFMNYGEPLLPNIFQFFKFDFEVDIKNRLKEYFVNYGTPQK